ncbi:MAG TPA: replication factor C small subunit [Candidatus Nanoarchaeia archaeon]|nr:replication factor C small subunit [Candidatus Nanoarchaeia archaeon]
MLDVWTEKYRPQKLLEIKGQEDITKRLDAFVKGKSFPHLLFAGPAGIGKTTAALAIAKELYGENWRDHVLELNASDNRGIDTIRGAVKDFARTRAMEEVPFKIIYLDECDALTREAQDALRRIMEDYTQTVRFILSCNYSSKIIPPIQSRCAIFRFKPLPKEVVVSVLGNVSESEGLKLEKDAADLIYEASEGDMRKAHNLMQACASVSKTIDLATVAQVVSFAEPKEIEMVVKYAIGGRFVDARRLLTDVMVKHGLSGVDIIKQIQKELQELEMDEKLKVNLVRACGEYEFRLVEGSNEFVQLYAMLADFAIIGRT